MSTCALWRVCVCARARASAINAYSLLAPPATASTTASVAAGHSALFRPLGVHSGAFPNRGCVKCLRGRIVNLVRNRKLEGAASHIHVHAHAVAPFVFSEPVPAFPVAVHLQGAFGSKKAITSTPVAQIRLNVDVRRCDSN